MNFRFKARHVFLTYPQAEALESKERVYNLLTDKWLPERIVVGQEAHEDGGLHFHVCMTARGTFDTRNERAFDLDGCHPNIQAVRKLKDVVAYCIKDGVYINKGYIVDNQDSLTELCLSEAAAGGTQGEIVTRVITKVGDRGLKAFAQIDGFVGYLRKPGVVHEPVKDFPGNFMMPMIGGDKIMQFKSDIELPIGERGERRSLWIYGPSRMGKTVLARSFGMHWYMNSAWNVDCYSDDAQYGVIDDVEWDRLKMHYKGLLGCQLDVTVTDKYRRKSVIRGGKCVVVLTNEMPEFTNEERGWLNANVNFVNCYSPLWQDFIDLTLFADDETNRWTIPPSE